MPLNRSIDSRFRDRAETGLPPLEADSLSSLRHEIEDLTSNQAEWIYQHYCDAIRRGPAPEPDNYLEAFPEHAGVLERLFLLHDAFDTTELRTWTEAGKLPEVGDILGPFELVRELGRGALARVYLAAQRDLDGRLSVLKVSARPSQESSLLARFHHPNIVDVQRRSSTVDGQFYLVSLPFLGGATLSTVLQESRRSSRGRLPGSGRDWLEWLDKVGAPEYVSDDPGRPARELIAGMSHEQTVAWMIARVAQALDHADRRGVSHGDIKPSNILITADAQPMLLDFNLAVDRGGHSGRKAAEGSSSDTGGTLLYMAPERLDLIASTATSETPAGQDRKIGPVENLLTGLRGLDRHRADVYGLGLVLWETLIGERPTLPRVLSREPAERARSMALLRRGESARVRTWNRLRLRGRIASGLLAILEHCLEPNPADRYARASELAQDLDRWRTGRPPLYASDSVLGAWSRIRRQRRVVFLGLTVTGLTATATLTLVHSQFQTTLRQQAEEKLSRVLDRVDSDSLPGMRPGSFQRHDPGELADRARRFLREYDVLGRDDFRDRSDIASLPDHERDDFQVFLVEQTLRYALAMGNCHDSPDDWRMGFEALEHVSRWEPSPVLDREARRLRRKCREALGSSLSLTGISSQPQSGSKSRDDGRGWVDDYLEGVCLEANHARQALAYFKATVRSRPNFFWAHARLAEAAARIGEHEQAAVALRHCLARRPLNPVLHNHLAAILYHLRSPDALLEAERALELAPDYGPAMETVGIIGRILGRPQLVTESLERLRGRARLGHPVPAGFEFGLRFGGRNGSQIDQQELKDYLTHVTRPGITAVPDLLSQRAESYLVLGQTQVALDLLKQVIAANPDHLRARYRRAMLLAWQGASEAIPELESLIRHPRFEELFQSNPNASYAFAALVHAQIRRGAFDASKETLKFATTYRKYLHPVQEHLDRTADLIRVLEDAEP